MKHDSWEELSDQQCEMVVGGVGAGDVPGAGVNGWGCGSCPSAGGGLINTGFTPPGEQISPGNSGLTVTVPGAKS